ncbi:hypothetical protein SHIRM173S_04148 [Streptomyces hirsutus]
MNGAAELLPTRATPIAGWIFTCTICWSMGSLSVGRAEPNIGMGAGVSAGRVRPLEGRLHAVGPGGSLCLRLPPRRRLLRVADLRQTRDGLVPAAPPDFFTCFPAADRYRILYACGHFDHRDRGCSHSLKNDPVPRTRAVALTVADSSGTDADSLLTVGVPEHRRPARMCARFVVFRNWIGRTQEEIEQARRDWREGTRFGEVKGYDGAPLPAPELPAVPLKPRGRVR